MFNVLLILEVQQILVVSAINLLIKHFYKCNHSYFIFALQIALEELAERVNGDIRMAINQLQYMSLSMSNIKYDDIRQRLLTSAKDEDISPFTAVDKYEHYSFLFIAIACF